MSTQIGKRVSGMEVSNNRVGYLGPAGTFTEEALRTQADLAKMDQIPLQTITDVILATSRGEVEFGFVPIENSIEGTVLAALDSLLFDSELLIQREVSLPITQNLMGIPGAVIDEISEVYSYPVAVAQCRRFLSEHIPTAELKFTTSTAEAARTVAEAANPKYAAIAPRLSAELYGLELLNQGIEDSKDNVTRFLLLHRSDIPKPTGSDKTTVVCFQVQDRPGSLLSILAQFAARGINLTKLDSRPTKKLMGEYCFIIDLEGHIADSMVADCLRELRIILPDLKFLGSYPIASVTNGPATSTEAQALSRAWIDDLRRRITE